MHWTESQPPIGPPDWYLKEQAAWERERREKEKAAEERQAAQCQVFFVHQLSQQKR